MFHRPFATAGFVVATSLSATGHAQKAQSVQAWITTADRTSLVAQQSTPIAFETSTSQAPAITVHSDQRFQKMEGFGFALTGGSAELLMRMSAPARTALLKELFSPKESSSIRVSYLRVSIGSSDMNDHAFTYDDLAAGETDKELAHFDLGPDRTTVIPVLKEILAIDPQIRILASPWSAPAWMKTNGALKNGNLLPEDYGVYAQYFVKYLHAMQALGIHVDAVTVQNEPLNPHNTPSMVMSAKEQATFIATALGPALHAAGLRTEIILYDHNCDKPEYPLEVLADAAASKYVAGSGFHLYGGAVGAMSQVHDAHPDKSVYFTEQMVVQRPNETSLKISGSVARIVIGATRNWSRNVLLWNLAADPNNGPHTSDGGCPICQGAVTLDGDNVTRNLAYYTIAQISRFVPPGSVRIGSEGPAEGELAQVAFETPQHSNVLLVSNRTSAPYTFVVHAGDHSFSATLAPLAVGTYLWR